MRYVLAIDQGTTGSTAVVVAESGQILGKFTCDFPQHYPQPGWVEHDLGEIWESVVNAVAGALRQAGVDQHECAAVGITNQRETTVVWDRSTGEPIHRAIVWQDRRTATRCAELKANGWESMVRARTGLVLDPYFSGTKIEWLLDHVHSARQRAESGELVFGTIDCWLVHRLSEHRVHVTDATNASRTLLFNIHQGGWDDELLAMFRVPKPMLPTVCDSSGIVGYTKGMPNLPDGVPIAGLAGDQHAALFGQTCFSPGEAKCTYGTGAFLLMNIGTTATPSSNGLITTIAWRLDGRVTYALEGSAFIAGAAVQWLRDGLGIIRTSAEIERLAGQVATAGDVMFVPALTGLGAPYWDPHARGLITGLTRDTTAAHIARATLEGIAQQVVDLAQAMRADASRDMTCLRVDGGAAMNNLLMQVQADLLGTKVERPMFVETTALGAAYLAGLATGVFPEMDSIKSAQKMERVFEPTMNATARNERRAKWAEAVARTRSDVTSLYSELRAEAGAKPRSAEGSRS